MISKLVTNAINNREDISQFIVHLTRDDRHDFSNGQTARENLISILNKKQIFATRPHCLFNKQLKSNHEFSELCRVACFTETPLSQIHLLTKEIEGREIKLEPYGVVFRKKFIKELNGQPAIYINGYDNNNAIKKSFLHLFDIAKSDLESPLWKIIPMVNIMSERYDFSWEREWRTSANVNFSNSDIVAIILPEKGEEKMKSTAAKFGIASISPGWSYEQIIYELSSQQKTTKNISLGENLIEQKIEV